MKPTCLALILTGLAVNLGGPALSQAPPSRSLQHQIPHVVALQSLDGTYRGQLQLTKDVEHTSGSDGCTLSGVGVEFRLTGAKISLDHPRSGQVFSGFMATDGRFQISFGHRAGKSGGWISADWKGTVKASRIAGNSVGIGPGRDCYHSFAAKKVGVTR
jgi:hypothetical protein